MRPFSSLYLRNGDLCSSLPVSPAFVSILLGRRGCARGELRWLPYRLNSCNMGRLGFLEEILKQEPGGWRCLRPNEFGALLTGNTTTVTFIGAPWFVPQLAQLIGYALNLTHKMALVSSDLAEEVAL